LIESGHLFLALPPLYRLAAGARSSTPADDKHKDELMKTVFKSKGKSRSAASRAWARCRRRSSRKQRWNPSKRVLLRVEIPKQQG